MESAIHHPCQSLADWKTMNDFDVPANGGRFVLSWAFHPKPLPLAVPAATTVKMAAMRGMDVVVAAPGRIRAARARSMAQARAARRCIAAAASRETSDRSEALEGAHVIYAKSWIVDAATTATSRTIKRRT